MQNEFDAMEDLLRPIQIIGVNGIDKDTKESFLLERDLPWLLDTRSENVWATWNVAYRDLLILDDENKPVAVFNLTELNLSDTDLYEQVKQTFVDLAQAP